MFSPKESERRGSPRALQLDRVVIKCIVVEMTRRSLVSGDEDETRGQWIIIRKLIRRIEKA